MRATCPFASEKLVHPDTLAITVTFQPEIAQLHRQLEILTKSYCDCMVVDNGSQNQAELSLYLAKNFPHVKLHVFNDNLGIASAQNTGIDYACANDYCFVLLMDQDSIPDLSMVKELKKALHLYPNAAAVGPVFLDDQQQIRSRFIRVDGFYVNKQLDPDSNGCVVVDHLIASGSLIPTSIFSKIGKMETGLFIDYVDIEWALRARSLGFQNYGVNSAQMVHSLGDRRVNLLKSSISIHSPLRHYYQVRNAIILYKRSYIPFNWKVVDAFKMMAKMLVYIATSRQKFFEFKMIVKGIMHGLRGINGRVR